MPAMLGEHIFFFSFVEAIVTVLGFAYIARNNQSIFLNKPVEKALDVATAK